MDIEAIRRMTHQHKQISDEVRQLEKDVEAIRCGVTIPEYEEPLTISIASDDLMGVRFDIAVNRHVLEAIAVKALEDKKLRLQEIADSIRAEALKEGP